MSSTLVLDNAPDTTTANISTSRRESLVWVTAGSCTVSWGGAVLTSLSVGNPKLLNIGRGEQLTFTATAGSTTAYIKNIQQENQ